MTATLLALPQSDTTPVRAELAAMRAIAESLDSLPDRRSRARVLRWATEFFDLKDGNQEAPPSPVSRAQRPKVAVQNDPSLAVADLSSFFEHESVDPDQMAVSWPAAESNGGVASMLHDFVADFQKLARDWQE